MMLSAISFCERRVVLGKGCLALLAAWFLASVPTAKAATVVTYAGGRITATGSDAGFVDGNRFTAAQFNQPSGLAFDRSRNLFVADTGNNAVRKLVTSGFDCTTVVRNVSRPVDVSFDAAGNLYVLSAGSGLILRYDPFDQLYQFPAAVNSTPFINPVAFVQDVSTNIFVVESGGAIKKLAPGASVPTTVVSGLGKLGGITILESGFLAVTVSDRNIIRIIDPADGSTVQTLGVPKAAITDGIYFRDGPGNLARFNNPEGITASPNNSLVVADRGNQRVRVVSADGIVSTAYGVDPSLWDVECLTCVPLILPGWYDGLNGDGATAEAREPARIAVDPNGIAYITEQYYHIIRIMANAGLGASGTGGSGGNTNLVVTAPSFTPDSGYHPMGVLIKVTNPNTNSFFRNTVYYTTDGTPPTTNSLMVNMTNGVGTILWRDTSHSLASLRVRAFVGATGSEVAVGRQADRNEVGLHRDLIAGMGSTVILPVAVSLRSGDANVLRSLQFRVEFKPTNGAPAIPSNLSVWPIKFDEFVPFATASKGTAPVAQYTPYSIGTTRGMLAAYIGNQANFQAKDFAVVTLLSVPIPATAVAGQGYWVSILEPSATSDAGETAVPIVAMPPRLITVTNLSYIVGDSSPAAWYNAETSGMTPSSSLGFGNGNLRNSDVNNAFSAALGKTYLPPTTDLFDAMDAWPEDSTTRAGGDGQIRFLDWQVILMRSLSLDTQNWRRTWSAGGRRIATSTTLNTNALDSPPATFDASLHAQVWNPPARITAGFKDNMEAGMTALIPITVNMSDTFRLAGMQFRLAVVPQGTTPALVLPVRFLTETNTLPEPLGVGGLPGNEFGAAWSLIQNPFTPALHGQTVLGTLVVTVPDSVRPGDSYRITFSHTSGAPDFTTEYDFDLVEGSLWIGTTRPSSEPPRVIRGIKLSWFGAQGARYAVESSTDLKSWNPVASDLIGTGRSLEYVDTQTTRSSQFYRVSETP